MLDEPLTKIDHDTTSELSEGLFVGSHIAVRLMDAEEPGASTPSHLQHRGNTRIDLLQTGFVTVQYAAYAPETGAKQTATWWLFAALRRSWRALGSLGIDSPSTINPLAERLARSYENDLEHIVDDMVQSFLQGGTDKFAMEFDVGNDPAMYGTMIIEKFGFGQNLEGIQFIPPNYISALSR